jgi:hypothetical protein
MYLSTKYQFEIIDANTLRLVGNITDAGSGTGHTLTPQHVYSNSTALGYNAEPTASNQVMLGDANVTQIVSAASLVITGDIISNAVAGMKFGTATTQKISFWNATPVVQPAHIADADGTLPDITIKFNTLLAQMATLGLQANT